MPAGSQSPHSMRTVRVLLKLMGLLLSGFAALSQPDRVAAAIRVFHTLRHHREAVGRKQVAVFGRRQARMIKRVAMEFADALAVPWSAGEQQRRAQRGVIEKNRKHPSLIVIGQMEKTVPGDETIKAAAERQRTHILDLPLLRGKAAPADRNHRRR